MQNPAVWLPNLPSVLLSIPLTYQSKHTLLRAKRPAWGPQLTRAARVEPVTPANSIFVTSFFAVDLAVKCTAHVTSDDAELKKRMTEARSSSQVGQGRPSLHLHKFPHTLHLPKGSGTIDVFSLHHNGEVPGVVWEQMRVDAIGEEAVKRAEAIAPIIVDPWLIRHPSSRHDRVFERLDRCREREEVCFISI